MLAEIGGVALLTVEIVFFRDGASFPELFGFLWRFAGGGAVAVVSTGAHCKLSFAKTGLVIGPNGVGFGVDCIWPA